MLPLHDNCKKIFLSHSTTAESWTVNSSFPPHQIKFASFMHALKIICSTAQSYDYPGGKDRKIERLQQSQVIKLALNG